jgi:hypothetical protein
LKPNYTKGHTVYDTSKVQWTMSVTIYHGPGFGHSIELVTETTGRPHDSTHDSLGTWRGVGCPSDVLREADTLISAALWNHVVARYGIAETLEGWGVEPDQF